jgi:hypothetical protein
MTAKKQRVPSGTPRWSSNLVHEVAFFQRHPNDDPSEPSPGYDAYMLWPPGVRAKANAVLSHVAQSPPKRVVGGGYWEVMKDEMAAWYEVRVDGPSRHHYRLYCLLDDNALNFSKPLIAVIDARDKEFLTELDKKEYRAVRTLGKEYLSRNPRSLKTEK